MFNIIGMFCQALVMILVASAREFDSFSLIIFIQGFTIIFYQFMGLLESME